MSSSVWKATPIFFVTLKLTTRDVTHKQGDGAVPELLQGARPIGLALIPVDGNRLPALARQIRLHLSGLLFV